MKVDALSSSRSRRAMYALWKAQLQPGSARSQGRASVAAAQRTKNAQSPLDAFEAIPPMKAAVTHAADLQAQEPRELVSLMRAARRAAGRAEPAPTLLPHLGAIAQSGPANHLLGQRAVTPFRPLGTASFVAS